MRRFVGWFHAYVIHAWCSPVHPLLLHLPLFFRQCTPSSHLSVRKVHLLPLSALPPHPIPVSTTPLVLLGVTVRAGHLVWVCISVGVRRGSCLSAPCRLAGITRRSSVGGLSQFWEGTSLAST